jgi:hypothetical protein
MTISLASHYIHTAIKMGSVVKVIVSPTDALVTRLQQVLMLINHPKAEVAIHCDDELRKCHSSMKRLMLYFNSSMSMN